MDAQSELLNLKTLWHLMFSRIRGETHAQRLESFYAGQANEYDMFRRRLLHGRDELFASVDVPEQGIWIDFGAGTGENAERLQDQLAKLKQLYLVDLCPSLLDIAQKRIRENFWSNVTAVHADATTFSLPLLRADVVSFSYSLTMIPDWFLAIENALRLLKPGGVIAVVDFYVSRKHPAQGRRRHHWLTRSGWPLWFGNDNVFPNPDHLPFLESHFETVSIAEGTGSVPYLPGVRMPYYRFVGRKSSVDRP
ncbi:MAG: class I SAM-dependent methyltransferase [Planctomycetaceae bacterium]|nr:class I SAM-dependent methyltransferase [Planctomycetaceae bacterium]